MQSMPKWAQVTLHKHMGDKRHLKPRQQLDDGTTGDEFWDAAQQQLRNTGELHNNVRMTWGECFEAAWACVTLPKLQACCVGPRGELCEAHCSHAHHHEPCCAWNATGPADATCLQATSTC